MKGILISSFEEVIKLFGCSIIFLLGIFISLFDKVIKLFCCSTILLLGIFNALFTEVVTKLFCCAKSSIGSPNILAFSFLSFEGINSMGCCIILFFCSIIS